MDTTTCLLQYPWRTLVALAAVYDVPAHHHHSKEQVAQELGAAIHIRLQETLAALSSDARAALRVLIQANDLALPRSDFVARFGPIHPYRPWNPHAPPAPWPTPRSPAATLVHCGLAYPLNLGTRQRPVHVLLLPHDLRDPLAIYLDLPVTLPPPVTPTSPHPHTRYDLDTDLFTFLSLLNREDYSVRHGRWLPPSALRALNTHLTPPDDLGAGRSELQAARTSFIHYLAERAGLVGLVGAWLKPTLIAHEWLAAPCSQRLRILWDVWCEPCDENRTLWRRYRLPALEEDDDPVARFHVLLETLSACPMGDLGPASNLLKALAEREPALLRPQATYAVWAALDSEERANFETRTRAVLLALLTGPLTWFGVIEWANSESENGRIGESATEQEGKSAPLPPCSSACPERSRRSPLLLSPLGAALLGRADGDWPAAPVSAPLHVAPLPDQSEEDTTITLYAPPGLPLLDRFALEGIVPPGPTRGQYRLTRPHFLRAQQRGHTVEGTVNFLERASAEPLPAPVLGSLYHWADEFNRVTIRQTMLLQTRDADLLRDLTGQHRVRETLGRTLNARTVEVRADRLNALLRRLAYRSITPRLDLPQVSPLPQAGEGLREDERVAIAAALRVYAHLADELGLLTRPAYALAQRWSEGLPLPIRDAVERTVEQTLEALHQAAPSEMEDRLPEPTGPLLGALETAVKEQSAVEIEYYTAGRSHLTVRRVEPLRLEWHGDVVYLIAHCHLRGDQRVFRVDRIARISE